MLNLTAWFAAFLTTSVPVAVVLGAAAAIHMVLRMQVPLSTVPARLFSGMDSFALMSIPFFILAGMLMNEVDLTSRLVRFAQFLVGRMRGGLAQVAVLTSMIFGGITGAATAEAAAVGSVMIPAMEKAGYRRDFSAAVVAAASCMGPIIPPSIPMLIYGVVSDTSIGKLFLAGAIPGILIGLAMMIVNYIQVRRMGANGPREDTEKRDVRGFLVALRTTAIALVMPVILVGGVVFGIFTPTESSVAAVFYALAVGFFIFRNLKLSRLRQILLQSAVMSSAVMLVVAAANLIGWVMAYERVPQTVAQAFLSVTDSPRLFLLFVILVVLVTGLFLEPTGAIIILTPVLLPAAKAYGFDPVHFGLVMVFGMVIGLIHPPVGLSLFITTSIAKVSFERLVVAITPYLLAIIAIYLLCAYVPAISMWLPGLLG